jgi:hypothetical protein
VVLEDLLAAVDTKIIHTEPSFQEGGSRPVASLSVVEDCYQETFRVEDQGPRG